MYSKINSRKLTRKEQKQIRAAADRAANKDPQKKTSQETVPFERVWPSGICRVTQGLYSITIRMEDTNYQLCDDSEQEAFLSAWGSFLNSFDNSVHLQLSELKLAANAEELAEQIPVRSRGNSYDSILEEYSRIIRNQLWQGCRGKVRIRCLTVSIHAENLDTAQPRLESLETEILSQLKAMNLEAAVLNGSRLLALLFSVFHTDEPVPFSFSWEELLPSGLSVKDLIAPSSFDFSNPRQFRMGKMFCSVGFLQILSSSVHDRILEDLLTSDQSMIVTVHAQPVDQAEAIRTVKHKITDLDRAKIDEQKRAVRSGYDMDILPSDLVTRCPGAKSLLEGLLNRDERMFLVTVLILCTGDSQKALQRNLLRVRSAAQTKNCRMVCLDFQQEAGFAGCLPLGHNPIEITRGLTTPSLSCFLPFTTREIFQTGQEALYCGINPLSGNGILADRKLLKNPNGLILGTPGSGKSFAAKREIANCFLMTDDDILICDPESEYAPLVQALHGQVIRISPSSPNHINPMDLILDYSDGEDPLSFKSSFLFSFFELILQEKNRFDPEMRSVLDSCIRSVYQPYLADPRPENMPILQDLYNLLLNHENSKAHRLATALALYVTGSQNVFNHQTSVNIHSRIVCYDIRDLGKPLEKLGMLVVQDQVWNRVTANRALRKSTRYYLDELHLLLQDELTAGFMVEIWKRFRKWGGIPTGITQNIADLLNSSQADSIFKNSEYICMLNQQGNDRDALTRFLGISAPQLTRVSQVGAGEGLLFYGTVIIPFVDHFPRDTQLYKIITTKLSEISKEEKINGKENI